MVQRKAGLRASPFGSHPNTPEQRLGWCFVWCRKNHFNSAQFPAPVNQFVHHVYAVHLMHDRYGRDAIPSMEQRAREREVERLERRAQSAERDKENHNFVARRIVRSSPQSDEGSGAVADGCGDIYERTTEYVRRKESR